MRRPLALAAFGGLLAAAAAGFGSPSLYVPGIALFLLAAGACAWVALAARGVRVSGGPVPATVEEGEPLVVTVEVGRGWLPPPVLELRDGETLRLPRARRQAIRRSFSFERRGARTLAPATVVVRDPLALVERRAATAAAEILVLPRVEPVTGLDTGAAHALGRAAPGAAELELDGLRPYRSGTPAARIHWPTVARRGEVLERRFVAGRESRPLVVVDARAPASEEALDRAVRAAASLCVHLGTRGGCALLLPGERRPLALDPDMRAWPALHARLALVECTERAPAGARSGAVFWVTAAVTPPDLRRLRAPLRYLVSAYGTAAAEVAGCALVRLDAGARRAA